MTSSNYVKIGEELNMLETKVYFGQSIYQNDGIQEHFVQNVSCLYKQITDFDDCGSKFKLSPKIVKRNANHLGL